MPRPKTRREMSNKDFWGKMLCALLFEPLPRPNSVLVKSALLPNTFCSRFLFGHVVRCIILLRGD